MQSVDSTDWSFPNSPTAPDYRLNWSALVAAHAWLQALDGVPQEPAFHAEGDVLIHTRMVAEALLALPAWRALPADAQALLFAAALFHDIAKPACTVVEPGGRIASPRHAQVGEGYARFELWSNATRYNSIPFWQREQISGLVRHHGLPLWFWDRAQQERAVITASHTARLDWVALLAEADVRGRICDDRAELLQRIELFRAFCVEQNCYTGARQFANDHSRFQYFRNESRSPDYAAYDDTQFEVVLMSGLPGAGKDTWIARHLSEHAVISLDRIRQARAIDPAESQGQVVREAREQARALLRRKQPFVWNATNTTRMLRSQLVELFASYGARVRIVYVEWPFDTLFERNRRHADAVPEQIIRRLAAKLDPPNRIEAHAVEIATE